MGLKDVAGFNCGCWYLKLRAASHELRARTISSIRSRLETGGL